MKILFRFLFMAALMTVVFFCLIVEAVFFRGGGVLPSKRSWLGSAWDEVRLFWRRVTCKEQKNWLDYKAVKTYQDHMTKTKDPEFIWRERTMNDITKAMMEHADEEFGVHGEASEYTYDGEGRRRQTRRGTQVCVSGNCGSREVYIPPIDLRKDISINPMDDKK